MQCSNVGRHGNRCRRETEDDEHRTCRPCLDSMQRYSKTPAGKVARRAVTLRKRLRDRGLTVEQLENLRLSQRNVCAICGLPEKRMRKGTLCDLAIDHDPATGRVRGLLCHYCNMGLGLFRHDPTLFRRAIQYLGVA